MIAVGVLLSFEILALAVVGLILFYAVIDLAIAQFLSWRDADPQAWVEDSTANRERER